jgi:hypothetical protein
MGEIPRHGLLDARLERLEGAPSEFPLEFRGVDRASAVVTRPVGDEPDQRLARSPRRGLHGVEDIADPMRHVQVRALVAAADIVGLAEQAALERESERKRNGLRSAGAASGVKKVQNSSILTWRLMPQFTIKANNMKKTTNLCAA